MTICRIEKNFLSSTGFPVRGLAMGPHASHEELVTIFISARKDCVVQDVRFEFLGKLVVVVSPRIVLCWIYRIVVQISTFVLGPFWFF